MDGDKNAISILGLYPDGTYHPLDIYNRCIRCRYTGVRYMDADEGLVLAGASLGIIMLIIWVIFIITLL